jgi:hypothetical protein
LLPVVAPPNVPLIGFTALNVPEAMAWVMCVDCSLADDESVSASPDPSNTFQKTAPVTLVDWLDCPSLFQFVPVPTLTVGAPSNAAHTNTRSPTAALAGMAMACEVALLPCRPVIRPLTAGKPAPADGLTDDDGVGLTDDDGDVEALGLVDGLVDEDGLTDALGLTDGETDEDGETLGLTLGLTLELFPADGDGLDEGLMEADALELGDTLADGLTLGLDSVVASVTRSARLSWTPCGWISIPLKPDPDANPAGGVMAMPAASTTSVPFLKNRA